MSADAAAAVRDPSNEVLLSAVSTWEIASKHRAGRLPLPEPPDRLIPAERRLRGVAALAFDEDAALQVAQNTTYGNTSQKVGSLKFMVKFALEE